METASTTFYPRSRKACEGNHESPHDCGGARYCDATGGEWYMRQAADGVAATPCICINGLLDELGERRLFYETVRIQPVSVGGSPGVSLPTVQGLVHIV